MLSSFAIDGNTGKLRLLNTVSSRGSGPCHVALDKTGRWIFAANYSNGSIASFPIRSDGTLGDAAASIQHTGASVNAQRQSGPHAHSVNISADNRFLVVTDLGIDQVLVYRFMPNRGNTERLPFSR
jgi:6-phosphogluconolactonase